MKGYSIVQNDQSWELRLTRRSKIYALSTTLFATIFFGLMSAAWMYASFDGRKNWIGFTIGLLCAIGAIAFGMVQLPRLIARLNGTLTIDRQLNAIDVFGQQLIPADVNCVILLTTPGSEGTDTRLLLTTDSEVLRLLETGNDWYDVSDWTIIGESMSRYLGVDFEKRSGEPEDQIQNWQQPPSCLTRYIAIAIAIAIIVLNVIIVFCFIAEFLWGHTHPSDSGGAANL